MTPDCLNEELDKPPTLYPEESRGRKKSIGALSLLTKLVLTQVLNLLLSVVVCFQTGAPDLRSQRI